MHRMQSGGWPYSEDGRDSSKAPSLRVAFLRTHVHVNSALAYMMKLNRAGQEHFVVEPIFHEWPTCMFRSKST